MRSPCLWKFADIYPAERRLFLGAASKSTTTKNWQASTELNNPEGLHHWLLCPWNLEGFSKRDCYVRLPYLLSEASFEALAPSDGMSTFSTLFPEVETSVLDSIDSASL